MSNEALTLTWHKNSGMSSYPPVNPEWRVSIRYRGGLDFDPTKYKESGLKAKDYQWLFRVGEDPGDILEYAVLP